MFNGDEDESLVDTYLSQAGFLTLLDSEDEDGNFWETKQTPGNDQVVTTRLEDQHAAWMCPFVPSSTTRVQSLLQLLNDLDSHDIVYDLGCGTGSVLLPLGKKFGCQCIGVDIDAKLIESAKALTTKEILPEKHSLFSWRCDDACTMPMDSPSPTVVILYLVPSALLQMERVMRDLWTRVEHLTLITLVYRFKSWAPSVEYPEDGIFVYHCKDALRRRSLGAVSRPAVVAAVAAAAGDAEQDEDDDEDGPKCGGAAMSLFGDLDTDTSSEEEDCSEEDGEASRDAVVVKAASWRNSASFRGKHTQRSENMKVKAGREKEKEKEDDEEEEDGLKCDFAAISLFGNLSTDSSSAEDDYLEDVEEVGNDDDEGTTDAVVVNAPSWRNTASFGGEHAEKRKMEEEQKVEVEEVEVEVEEAAEVVGTAIGGKSNSGGNSNSGDESGSAAAASSYPSSSTLLPDGATRDEDGTSLTPLYSQACEDTRRNDDEAKQPTTLFVFDAGLSADSIECCPVSGFESVCVCATYKLEGDVRVGSLHVCDASTWWEEKEDKVERSDNERDCQSGAKSRSVPRVVPLPEPAWFGSGVLDCKWSTLCGVSSSTTSSSSPLLGSVHANGTFLLHKLEGTTLVPACSPVGEVGATIFLSLDFDDRLSFSPSSSPTSSPSSLRTIVSRADGYLDLWDLGGLSSSIPSPRVVHSFKGHELYGGHPSEAWIAAFDCWHPNHIISGGDDGKFRGWDCRTSCQHPTFDLRYDAGVCSAQFDSYREHRMVVGGYFGTVDVYDMRRMNHRSSVLNSFVAGGGVWRLKWHPTVVGKLVAACMRGGVRVFQDSTRNDLEEHGMTHHYLGHPAESLAYGVDWNRCRLSGGGGGGVEVGGGVQEEEEMLISCSFYDRQMHVWRL